MSGLDVSTHLETWTRYNYDKVWYFGGKGAAINKGYDNANDVEIRIPYDENENLNIEHLRQSYGKMKKAIKNGTLQMKPSVLPKSITRHCRQANMSLRHKPSQQMASGVFLLLYM